MSLVLPSVQAERGTELRERHSDDAHLCLHLYVFPAYIIIY